jgi:hypothetical protein
MLEARCHPRIENRGKSFCVAAQSVTIKDIRLRGKRVLLIRASLDGFAYCPYGHKTSKLVIFGGNG